VEKAYGVDRYAIAAIWASNRLLDPDGRRNVVSRPRRLACVVAARPISRTNPHRTRNPHRAICAPSRCGGSWPRVRADAIHADRLQRYAVDGDGDGRRDVVDNAADLIASTANNLKKDGWQSGQTWALRWCCAGF